MEKSELEKRLDRERFYNNLDEIEGHLKTADRLLNKISASPLDVTIMIHDNLADGLAIIDEIRENMND